jgi:hypothetical protein
MGELELSVVQPGWEVYSSDGERVGRVDEVALDQFTLELEVVGGSSVPIPFGSVTDAADGRVDLDLPAEEIGGIAWEDPTAT